jgi:hypothetical protein
MAGSFAGNSREQMPQAAPCLALNSVPAQQQPAPCLARLTALVSLFIACPAAPTLTISGASGWAGPLPMRSMCFLRSVLRYSNTR